MMFDEQEYREVFSQVKASDGLTRRVMTMKREKKYSGRRALGRMVLVAAALALMALTVSASEVVQNWFLEFFQEKNEEGLSQGQVEYIEDNAQTIADSQTQDGWMVELVSAMNDNSTGYVILRIEGPEGTDLTPYIFGNQGVRGHFEGLPDMITPPEDVIWYSWGWSWMDDQDGKDNTRNLIIHMNPNTKDGLNEPFGADKVFSLSLINLVREYEDEAYKQELMNGKYAGQSLPGLNSEETLKVFQHEVIAEKTWNFEFTFDNLSSEGDVLNILSDAVRTKASFIQDLPAGEIDDFTFEKRDVWLTDIEMDHLTVSFTMGQCESNPNLQLYEGDKVLYPCVVMKDGSQVQLIPYGSDGAMTQHMLAAAPLVYDDIDHILMADGTIIPMPDTTE